MPAHIPFIIPPGIDFAVVGRHEGVQLRSINLLSVYPKTDFVNAEFITGTGHIIIGPIGKADLSPGLKRTDVLSRSKRYGIQRTAHRTLPGLGINTDTMHLWSDLIAHQMPEIRHGIQQGSVGRTMQFQMQMRTGRSTRIAADSNLLAGLYRKLSGSETHIYSLRFLFTLAGKDFPGHIRQKTVQMAIHRSVAVGMIHIQGIAETVQTHGSPGDITVGHTIDFLSDHSLRTEIQSAMKVVRTRLTEISGQRHGKINGRYITFLSLHRQRCQTQNPDRKQTGNTHRHKI